MKKGKAIDIVIKYTKVFIGSALYAVGFQFFMYPHSIVPGGISGIAMIINYLTQLPVGVLTIILNIPLFIVAWRKMGLSFVISSMIGLVLTSVMIDLLSMVSFEVTDQILLACIYGGAIKGLGLGLIYSAGTSTGGIDIPARLLRRKYPYINYGTLVLYLDIVVILAFAVIFKKYESAMYALVAMFIVSKVVDLVLYGASASKVCYIITDSSDAVKNAITETLRRGVTYLHGEGAYSRKNKEVILCVIKPQQIVELRKAVREIDEAAFIIISDAREVFGNGFADIKSND